MPADWSSLIGVLIAALGGAAIGLERQRSGHATGPQARFAGVRTFTLLGGYAGLAGWLWTQQAQVLAAVLLAGAAAFVVVAYWAASRRDVEGTTEVAGLVVMVAGLLAGMQQTILSSAVIAITVLLLVEKSALHELAELPDDVGFRAGVRFGVMALVILPLLPEGPYGPWGGIRPRELWILVLFFSGLSFVGYILRNILGPKLGYPVAGTLGGLISSTNVAFVFARTSRAEKALAAPLTLGVLGACTLLFLRVLVATAVLNRELAMALLPYFALPFLAGVLMTVIGIYRTKTRAGKPGQAVNPLQFWSALKMTILFQMVLYGVYFAKERFGSAGMLTMGAVLGLTDMDALTISMAKSTAADALKVGAQAIVIGIISNTVLKAAFALFLGSRPFWQSTVAGLGVIGAMLGAALLVL